MSLLSQLDTVENKKTGSTFYTIAMNEQGLLASLRIWSEKGPTPAHTVLMFRLRLEMSADAVPVADFGHYIATTYPKQKWTSKSKDYVSLAGHMLINLPIWNSDGILQTLSTNNAFTLIIDLMKKSFPDMALILSDEDTIGALYEMTENVLNQGSADAPTQPCLVLQFGNHKQKMQEGEVVGQVEQYDEPEEPAKPSKFPKTIPDNIINPDDDHSEAHSDVGL